MDIKFSIGNYVLVINPSMKNLYYKIGRVDAVRRDRDTMFYRVDFEDCMLHDEEYYIQENDLRLFKKFNKGDRVKITDNNGILVDEIRNKIGTVINFKVHYFRGHADQIMYDICLDGKKECLSLDSRYVDTVPMGVNYNQMYRRNEMKTRDEKQTIYDCIDKVIFNGDRTIILWKSGNKTMVKCAEDEEFDYYSGFCAALAKKIFGSTANAQKFLESKMVDQNRKEELSVDSPQVAVDLFRAASDRFRKGALNSFKKENLKSAILYLHANSDSLAPDILFKKMSELYEKYGKDSVNDALSEYVTDIKK